MASLVERSFDLEAIRENRKQKIRVAIAAAAVLFVCAALLVFAARWYTHRQYTSYTVEKSVKVSNGTSLEYISYQDGVLRYGRDGVTAVDSKGNTLWGASYDMSNPQVDTCGSSVVVADIGNKTLYVYKDGDTGTELTVDYPIAQACVSSQGVVAVTLQDGASDTIALYNPFDKSNTLLAEIPTNVEDGYPVSMDISPDGTSVVAAYLCVTTGSIVSRVAFYNFSEVGKNTNNLVGAHNYKKALISEVQFMDNTTVCLFGEDGFYLWENMKQPVKVAKRVFKKDIQSAFIDEDYVGVIVKKNSDTGVLRLYGADGKKKLERKVDASYTQVEIRGKEILLSSANQCAVYRLNGTQKYKQELSGSISYFFPCAGRNRYYIIQNSKIKIVKLKA